MNCVICETELMEEYRDIGPFYTDEARNGGRITQCTGYQVCPKYRIVYRELKINEK